MAGRVAESHEPLLVNIGVKSWKAKSVPVGRSLARFAVLVNARCDSDCGGVGGGDRDVGLSVVIVDFCLAR